MQDFELVIGIHSIEASLSTRLSEVRKLYYTEEAKKEVGAQKKWKDYFALPCAQQISSGSLQNMAQKMMQDLDFTYQRIPSGMFCVVERRQFLDLENLYNALKEKTIKKILCLDGVTDIHNGGAILRTASFYGVDAIIWGLRFEKGISPGLYRNASGAVDFLNLYQTNHLNRVVQKLGELGVTTIGLSEHATDSVNEREPSDEPIALILGAEDKGISNAVMRNVQKKMALATLGKIESLNVSVAAAVCMEKLFSTL